MSFDIIALPGSRTFNSIGNGLYSNASVAFGAPLDLLKITGGRKRGTNTYASITRHKEKDVTVSGVTTRYRVSASTQLIVPSAFTTAEIITSFIADPTSFLSDSALLTRLLLGES